MTTNKIIAVVGATGKQGGAVAARLLADGWSVRALTRDPSKPAAKALAGNGAEVVAADLDDRASLDAAFDGAWGVYSVHSGAFDGNEYGHDPQHEVRSGINVVDAAVAAGASHLVYSSSVGVDDPNLEPAMPILQYKKKIEQHIAASGIPATVLRPCSFMENYLGEHRGLRDGNLVTALGAQSPEPLIAVADIGIFAALAFADPKQYRGQVIELAGDTLTQPEIAAAIGRTTGEEVGYVRIPVEEVRKVSEDTARALDAMNHHPLHIDVAALRRQHPGLLNFDAWLAANRDAVVAKVKQRDTSG
ncbi:MAG: NmrA/HSCARG family protein [Stackebrandtia sp.]